jgi:hypothetical protein
MKTETNGQVYLAQCKQGHFIHLSAAEAMKGLNKTVLKGNGKPVAVALYRVPADTKVKGNKIMTPDNSRPVLAGLTSSDQSFDDKKANGYKATAKKTNRRPVAGEARSYAAGDPRTVDCPKCGAKGGHPCVRDNGKVQHNTHRARKDAAAGVKPEAKAKVQPKAKGTTKGKPEPKKATPEPKAKAPKAKRQVTRKR